MTVRVLLVNGFGVLGGAERWVLDVVEHLVDVEVPTAVLLADGPLGARLRDRGIEVVVRPTGSSPLAIAGASVHLARRMTRRRVDVVLANGVKAAAAAVTAGRLTRTPVVWAKHDYSFDGGLTRLLGRMSAAVIAPTAEVAAATGVVPTLAPPGAPPPPAGRDEARRFWARRGVVLGAAPTVVMATRLDPVKGVDDAVQALARPEAAAWQLVVVGVDAPEHAGESDRLRRLAARLGVDDRVQLVGEVDRAGHWFAAFDAVAVLTRQDGRHGREGFGMTALEAAAAGVPVIGVATSPFVARVARVGGVVTAPDDPGAVARALMSVATAVPDPSPLHRLAAEHPDASSVGARVSAALHAAAAERPVA